MSRRRRGRRSLHRIRLKATLEVGGIANRPGRKLQGSLLLQIGYRPRHSGRCLHLGVARAGEGHCGVVALEGLVSLNGVWLVAASLSRWWGGDVRLGNSDTEIIQAPSLTCSYTDRLQLGLCALSS